MKKLLLLLMLAFVGSIASKAYDFVADGIYYSVISEEEKTVAVVCGHTEKIVNQAPDYVGPARDAMVFDYMDWVGNSYKGDIVIPETVRRNDSLSDDYYTVTTISCGAFCKSVELTSVVLPKTLVQVETGAFHGCSALQELILPDGVESIGPNAFYKCVNMKKLHLSRGCTDIPAQSFISCGALAEDGLELTGVENVTSIGHRAFCYSGLRIYPNWEKLTSIGFSAFSNSQIEEVYIPQACGNHHSIGDYDSCARLKRVTIALTSLDQLYGCLDEYFDDSNAIELIRIYAEKPGSLFKDWALNCAEGCVLEVPAEAVEAYKSAPKWQNFAVIRALDSAGVESVAGEEFRAVGLTGAVDVSGCRSVQIADLSGKILFSGEPGRIQLPTGLYLVTVGDQSLKVLVK